MEESPQILRFDEIPSAEEFASQIEPKNVPAVFNGCVKDWKAIFKWNVSEGGLDYLQELVGSSVVEAMLSRSAPVFYGDIRSHERVLLPFSTFVGYCKDLIRYADEGHNSFSGLNKHQPVGLATQPGDPLILEEAPQQIYLAQVPILNSENEEKVQLECLREDIETPAFLRGKLLASVNLWMNNARTRSSTHYDPHHNLLCIISGCKEGELPFVVSFPCVLELGVGLKIVIDSHLCPLKIHVVLWPPSATPFLYPLPLYGEASNHSAIALESPDFHTYPRATCLDKYSQKVILHAGDALFIPEGWFHQVDSGNVTIAVNFWWRSEMVSGMLEHMDAYYMRRILKRLTDKETDRIKFCMCIRLQWIKR